LLQNEDLTNDNQWAVTDAVKNMFMTGQNSPTNGVMIIAVLISPAELTK
jgi:hypothetical protein